MLEVLTHEAVETLRRRARVLLLVHAAERAGVAPIETERLHALAYLADILSPVWGLAALDKFVLKEVGGPYYPELQREADRLVVLGLLEVSSIEYVDRPQEGARIVGKYGLRFASEHLDALLDALGARDAKAALDPADVEIHKYLTELAGALARLPHDEIDKAAAVDVTYSNSDIDTNNLVYVTPVAGQNASVMTTGRFADFLPSGAHLTSGEKLYLYATYLGRRLHGT